MAGFQLSTEDPTHDLSCEPDDDVPSVQVHPNSRTFWTGKFPRAGGAGA